MNKLNAWDWIAIVLLIIGGINWGLIGLFSFDLVGQIFGVMGTLTRIIYVLVGLSGLYMIIVSGMLAKKS